MDKKIIESYECPHCKGCGRLPVKKQFNYVEFKQWKKDDLKGVAEHIVDWNDSIGLRDIYEIVDDLFNHNLLNENGDKVYYEIYQMLYKKKDKFIENILGKKHAIEVKNEKINIV